MDLEILPTVIFKLFNKTIVVRITFLNKLRLLQSD